MSSRRPRTPRRVWAVVGGGGTGGHAGPAVAIGRALVERGHAPESILFVGSARGIERRMVPAAGFRIALLPGRGIARRWTWANVGAAIGLLAGTLRAVWLLARSRPAVVVAVGGYASVGCSIAAVTLRIPLVVAEQNAVPGLANRLAGRFARACAVSFPGTPLPRAVVTGNPVRPEILKADRSLAGRSAARAALGLPLDAFVVVVAGGSLGAQTLNRSTVELVKLWSERARVAIRHVVGERDFDEIHQGAPIVDGGLLYQQVRFEDRMDLVLSAADLAVQRAGASTVAELTAVGLASVLVPLPGAPGDHQTMNARRLAEAGAAVVVPDGELDGPRLAAEIDRLMQDSELRVSMADAARSLARPDAADAVAKLVEAHARG